MAEKAGIDTIQAAIDADGILKKEVGLDLLKDWVSICATAHSDMPVVLETNPAHRVPFTRVDAPAELKVMGCLLYTSPSPRDLSTSRMPSSA